MLVRKVFGCIMAIPRANIPTVIIAVLGCAFLYLGREFLNGPFQRRFRVPIPLELVLVIVAVAASVTLNLETNFHVEVVKHVPNG